MTSIQEDNVNDPMDVGDHQITPVNDDAGEDSPNSQATMTDEKHIEEWLNASLVEFKNDYNITCEIGVEEYLNITTTKPNNPACWLETGSLDVAFALLTKRDGRKNVCALTIQQGVDLFWLGIGGSEMEDFLREGIIQRALKDEKKRFIVVLVNDGPLVLYNRDQAKRKQEVEGTEKRSAEEDEESPTVEVQGGSAQDERMPEVRNDLERAEEDALMPDVPQEYSNEWEEDFEEIGESPTGQKAFGSHWGLLVIDKQERRARWIDGNLSLTRSTKHPSKMRIHFMSPAGTVAGKILCAIEQVLGPERGKFDAKTAKYVPHQTDDNSFQGDAGACGPYAFAFLDYLYKNPMYMRSLHTAFQRRKWNKHRADMQFDSLYTRVAMQKIIQDKSEEEPGLDELPLRMTPDVFRILKPKVLAPLVATAYRSHKRKSDPAGLFDRFDFRRHGRGNDDRGNKPGGGGRGGNGGGGNGGHRPGGGNRPSGPPPPLPPPPPPRGPKQKEVYDTDEEDKLDDTFIYDLDDPENTHISKSILRGIIREQPHVFVDVETKDEAYNLAYQTMKDDHAEAEKILAAAGDAAAVTGIPTTSSAPTTTSAPTASSAPTVTGAPTTTGTLKNPNNSPQRSRHPILQFPDAIKELPVDFADEQNVPSSQIKLWRQRNLDQIKECALGKKATEDGVSVRAILQVLSGTKFADETNPRLTSIWINDPEVFTDEDRKVLPGFPGVIADKMKEKYEIFNMQDKKRPCGAEEDMGGGKRVRTGGEQGDGGEVAEDGIDNLDDFGSEEEAEEEDDDDDDDNDDDDTSKSSQE